MKKLSDFIGRTDRKKGSKSWLTAETPWLAAAALWLTAAAFYAAEWTSFAAVRVYVGEVPSVGGQLLKAALDSLLVFSLVWLVPNGRRLTRALRCAALAVPLWYISIVLIVYDLYGRIFAAVPTLDLRAMQANTGFVVASGLRMWRPIDWLYLALPLLFTAECCGPLGRALGRLRLPGWLRAVAFAGSIAAFAAFQHLQTPRLVAVMQFEQEDDNLARMRQYRYFDNISPEQSLYVNGLPLHLMRGLWIDLVQRRRDAGRHAEINQFLADLAAARPLHPDSLFSANRGKNLIVIMVESLNADAVCRTTASGRPVMPYLRSIATDSTGVVAALDMVSQAGAGVSSDGQMMYQTGVLPQPNKATAFMYYNNAFPPALPQQLHPAAAFEVIGDHADVWYHNRFSTKYGYQALYDIDDVTRATPAGNPAKTGYDGAILSFALNRIKEAPQPLVAHITTLSMHHPFHPAPGTDCSDILADPTLSPTEQRYYSACRYFDAQLQAFIAGLQAAGRYTNSVIVIASDHSCVISAVEAEETATPEASTPPTASGDDNRPGMLDGRVAFVAMNTGATRHIDQTVAQIDAYPTILDIMALPDTTLWRGLGRSFASGRPTSPVTDRHGRPLPSPTPQASPQEAFTPHDTLLSTRAWEISDLLIRTNHFSPTQP